MYPRFIQKDSKGDRNTYQYCLVYKFFAYSKKYNTKFKYIIRAEAHKDCFAIKFYCSRAKYSLDKYSKILNVFSASEVKKILSCVSQVIPIILKINPLASFCFMGAQTIDRNGRKEKIENTQRFRIYKEIIKRLFGDNIFEIITFKKSSSVLFINKNAYSDLTEAKKLILDNLYSIYDFEI